MGTMYLKALLITLFSISLYCAEPDVKIDQEALSKQLFGAIEREDIDKVRRILDIADFDVYEAVDDEGDNSLHKAALKGNSEIVNLLLQKDENLIDWINNQLLTPLHYAVYSNNPAIVTKLLEIKPDLINEVDEVEISPLHIAALYARLPIVQILLDKNAQINSANLAGDTVFHYATDNENVEYFKELAKLLLQYQASLYKKNNNGQTVLDLITERHGLGVAQEIESLAAQPLFNAVTVGSLDQVKTLLENGYNPFAKNESGRTLLEVTEQVGQKEIADFLKELSTDPITAEELTNLALTDLIYYNDRMWTKKSLFNSALNAMIVDPENPNNPVAGVPLDPYNRQPLPPPILDKLKQHFKITAEEYDWLVSIKKDAEEFRGLLSMEGYEPNPGDRKVWQESLDQYDKAINDFLRQKEIL